MVWIVYGTIGAFVLFGVLWWWVLLRYMLRAKGRHARALKIVGLLLLSFSCAEIFLIGYLGHVFFAIITVFTPPIVALIAGALIFEFSLWVFASLFVGIALLLVVTLNLQLFRDDKFAVFIFGALLTFVPIYSQQVYFTHKTYREFEKIEGECLTTRSFLESARNAPQLKFSWAPVGDPHAVALKGSSVYIWSYSLGKFIEYHPSFDEDLTYRMHDNQCEEFGHV